MSRNAFALAFVACALSALMLYDGHNWGGDFSQYIAQSIALIDNSVDSQIENNTWIIQNSFYGLGPFIYPWGSSLIIAPFYKIFGFDLVAFKLPFCILFGAFVFVFYRFCNHIVGARYALIASLIFALNPLFLHFSNNIISDIPFMLFSFVSVVCLAGLFIANRGGGSKIIHGKIIHRKMIHATF